MFLLDKRMSEIIHFEDDNAKRRHVCVTVHCLLSAPLKKSLILQFHSCHRACLNQPASSQVSGTQRRKSAPRRQPEQPCGLTEGMQRARASTAVTLRAPLARHSRAVHAQPKCPKSPAVTLKEPHVIHSGAKYIILSSLALMPTLRGKHRSRSSPTDSKSEHKKTFFWWCYLD